MMKFKKERFVEPKVLPEPTLKRIPITEIKFAPYELLASASLFMKFGILRPGRADGACYHIAKQINELYEAEINKPKRSRKAKVV